MLHCLITHCLIVVLVSELMMIISIFSLNEESLLSIFGELLIKKNTLYSSRINNNRMRACYELMKKAFMFSIELASHFLRTVVELSVLMYR